MSSLKQLEVRNELVSWQVAPAEYEIAHYDQPKFEYRQYVERFIKPLAAKNVKKKQFYTIATNVLCADIHTSKQTIDPIDRDLYMPLEISITKWSLALGKEPLETRKFDTKVWMFNPGQPPRNCINYSRDHAKSHKITFDPKDDYEQNDYIEKDLVKAMKEINSFLSADRTVFSLGLKRVRQDIGCLKWLNRASEYKAKPIKVYSLEDLYVVLVRHFIAEEQVDLPMIGQGLARVHMEHASDTYNPELQCEYHVTNAKLEDGECGCCAKAMSQGWTNVLIDDVIRFTGLFDDAEPATSGAVTTATVSPKKQAVQGG